MPYPQLDRDQLLIHTLAERHSKVSIARDHLSVNAPSREFTGAGGAVFQEAVGRIREARKNGKPVMLTFGAHAIKNGLGPVLIRLMEEGWVTHLATNGAGIIHDWEFAYHGNSSEDVRANVASGTFGIWQETGFHINLALVVGAYEGLGYGEAVGAMIHNEALTIPAAAELAAVVRDTVDTDPDRAAAAADLLYTVRKFDLAPGRLAIPHPFKQYSVQGNAYRLRVPFTGHPMIGHDIIYNHPLNHGAAIGRTALRDFLTFASQVGQLDGGVYLSVGSAVMSPMIFEKSLAMAQNLMLQQGKHIDRHFMLVVDLAQSSWDWSRDGEPPMDNPAYYLRYCKTFSRMGGTMHYLSADNRDFLLQLHRTLAGN
jgi:hypothetical protein